jgi:DNA-binding NarL/FixJ family response regulator
MPAIAYVTDLIFATKIASTAKSMGVDVQVVRDLPSTIGAVQAAASPPLVIIDLDASGDDPLEVLRQCGALSPSPRTLAYVSHVRADLIRAARESGAGEVLARSAFTARLPEILEGARDAT